LFDARPALFKGSTYKGEKLDDKTSDELFDLMKFDTDTFIT